MPEYGQFLHKLVENHYATIATAILPVSFMLVDAWFKSWLKFDWKTYGADTALCGVATLGSTVFATVWVSPLPILAAVILLAFHVFLWTVVLKLASVYHHSLQAVTGSLVCFSALLLAIYYMKGIKN
jgi:hypothetical protein